MRREERVTVQGPVKEQQPDGMSHRGEGLPPSQCILGPPPSRLQYCGVGRHSMTLQQRARRRCRVWSLRRCPFAGNGVGPEGCQAFCEALKTNRTITSVGLGSMPLPTLPCGPRGCCCEAERLVSAAAVCPFASAFFFLWLQIVSGTGGGWLGGGGGGYGTKSALRCWGRRYWAELRGGVRTGGWLDVERFRGDEN